MFPLLYTPGLAGPGDTYLQATTSLLFNFQNWIETTLIVPLWSFSFLATLVALHFTPVSE